MDLIRFRFSGLIVRFGGAVVLLALLGAVLAPQVWAKGDAPRLWGTLETKQPDMKRMKKWREAVARFKGEDHLLTRPCDPKGYKSCGMLYWNKFIQGLKGKPPVEQVAAVHKYVNQSRYVHDFTNWRLRDYWESPGQFYDKPCLSG